MIAAAAAVAVGWRVAGSFAADWPAVAVAVVAGAAAVAVGWRVAGSFVADWPAVAVAVVAGAAAVAAVAGEGDWISFLWIAPTKATDS